MRPFALGSSLRPYRREWLRADLLAAATLLVIAIPEQLASSRLAGMPPITGFYAFAAGTLMFALLGTNSRLSVGADSTIAPLFAAAVGGFALTGSARYTDMIGILAVMVGLVVAMVWILRLGWIAEFLSAPIITGFMAGISIVIVVHQLPDLLGIAGAGSTTLGRLRHVVDSLGTVHVWPLAIGLGVLLIVLAAERVDARIPGALIALVASTLLVSVAGLEHHGVTILGHVSHNAPRLGLRGLSWKTIAQLAPVAGTVALVVVSQSAATTRAFGHGSGPEEHHLDVGQDLLAVGIGNVLAGLVGAFPVDASPPRTAAVAQAGGRTQLTGIVAAVVLVALIPAAGVLTDVPLATLAGVLLFVAGRIFHGHELVTIGRFDRFELVLALITLLTVALLGVEQGIGVAVALAILDRTRISAQPELHILGRIPGTTSWAPLQSTPEVQQAPDVLVVLFATPLWYANAVHFQAQLRAAVSAAGSAGAHPRAVVLDALGLNDIDYTGVQALRETLTELADQGIGFAVARAAHSVREELQRAQLVPDAIPDSHFYPDVEAAVQAFTPA